MCYKALEDWLGLKPDEIPFEDYAFLSGLLQAEGLREYIDNYRRRMFSSSSAIFWMYNDTWPASHGWTIVDYYLRRKLAYHPVRRAFAPVHVVAAVEGDKILIFGINETPRPWTGEARYGLFKLAGGLPIDETMLCDAAAERIDSDRRSRRCPSWSRLGRERRRVRGAC